MNRRKLVAQLACYWVIASVDGSSAASIPGATVYRKALPDGRSIVANLRKMSQRESLKEWRRQNRYWRTRHEREVASLPSHERALRRWVDLKRPVWTDEVILFTRFADGTDERIFQRIPIFRDGVGDGGGYGFGKSLRIMDALSENNRLLCLVDYGAVVLGIVVGPGENEVGPFNATLIRAEDYQWHPPYSGKLTGSFAGRNVTARLFQLPSGKEIVRYMLREEEGEEPYWARLKWRNNQWVDENPPRNVKFQRKNVGWVIVSVVGLLSMGALLVMGERVVRRKRRRGPNHAPPH